MLENGRHPVFRENPAGTVVPAYQDQRGFPAIPSIGNRFTRSGIDQAGFRPDTPG
jgi:hypothetical protein